MIHDVGTSPLQTSGLPGSGTPTATADSKGYLADLLATGTVQLIDKSTQTTMKSFSPQLCLDLIDTLSEDQMTLELWRTCDEKLIKARGKLRKSNALVDHFKQVVLEDSNDLTHDLNKLTSNFARHVTDANKQLEQLKENVVRAQTIVKDLQQPAAPAASDVPLLPPPAPLPSISSSTGNLEPAGILLPYTLSADNSFKQFQAAHLDNNTKYDRNFGNRKVAHYGNMPYHYPGGRHEARDINTNTYLANIIDHLNSVLPDGHKPFNSFLVTKYDNHMSHIPPHSDNEQSIDPESTILTITLGAPRPVVFRIKPPGSYKRFSLTPEHGSMYTMTRASQDEFDHSVPRIEEHDFSGIRMSITCRVLASLPYQRSKSSSARPKRVLILSDSKNKSFDCSVLHEPVVAFREDLFHLRDLNQHFRSIEQADVVLLSAGINDLRKHHAHPSTLHDFIERSVDQYKNTKFIFDSISPLSMNADRFNHMNQSIDKLNMALFELSLRTFNFKLFDNVKFGMPHLARDGLHLNLAGQSVLSECWVHCILLALGLKRGYLPLRRQYRNLCCEFSFRVK